MGLSDVIKNLFSSSDELEYFDDEQMQYEEEAPKRSLIDLFKNRKNNNQTQMQQAPLINPFLRQNTQNQYGNNGIIKSIAPTDFNTASRNIVSDLKSGFILILNLEGSPIELQNRILDFTYGCVCALNGNLKKISNSIYITGIDVDLSAFASSFSNSVYNNMNGNYNNTTANTNNNFNNIFHSANNQENGQQNQNINQNYSPNNQFPNINNNSQNFWNNFQNTNQAQFNTPNFQNNYQNFMPNNNVQKPNFFHKR